MQTDAVEEWRRLTEHYRTLSDDQLRELAIDLTDLTDLAQQVLRGEIKNRRLGDPEALRPVERDLAPEISYDASSEQGDDLPHEYTWKTLLCECNTHEEAWQLSELLRRAGIESWIDGPGFYSPHAELELINPRILVAADELDQARLIVSRPIPQDIVDESRVRMPEFELPACPACGTADPLLEGVDPVNLWRCEACGRQWTDPGGEPEDTQETGRH